MTVKVLWKHSNLLVASHCTVLKASTHRCVPLGRILQ
jgi:hypothetical protein